MKNNISPKKAGRILYGPNGHPIEAVSIAAVPRRIIRCVFVPSVASNGVPNNLDSLPEPGTAISWSPKGPYILLRVARATKEEELPEWASEFMGAGAYLEVELKLHST